MTATYERPPVQETVIQLDTNIDSKAFGPRRPAFNVLTKPIGPICNLDCAYCYYLEKQKLYGAGESYRMADNLLETYIRQYIEGQSAPEIQMAWQGGEPTLLGVDFFRRVVSIQQRYANGKQITNALQTNGTLLDQQWASFLAENKFLVGISIDGPEEQHDKYRVDKNQRPTFESVMRGVELLKENNVEFNTLTVVSRANQDHGLRTYQFLTGMGSRYIQFIPLVERAPDFAARSLGLDHALPPNGESPGASRVTPWSVDAQAYGSFLTTVFDYWVRNDVGKVFVQLFDIALSQWVTGRSGLCIFEETCGASLAIEHNGDLYSCDHYVYPQYKLGNIEETPLSELVSLERQYRFGNDKRDGLTQYCKQCDVRYACNGDCPKHRFAVSPEGEEGLSYLCPAYKHFFTHTQSSVKIMAELLRSRQAPAGIMNLLGVKDARIAEEEVRRQTELRWKTAQRNAPCPCGSGRKYKHCCLGAKNGNQPA